MDNYQSAHPAEIDLKGQSLLIRADANTRIGSGHVMRCLALALVWQAQGGRVTLLSDCPNAALRQRFENARIDFIPLERAHPDPSDLSTLLTELMRLVEQDQAPPWCVLDGYHFDPAYQKAIREAGYRLLVVDDTAHLPAYHADILLNQNIYAPQLTYPYDPHMVLLLGPKYALLRPEFLVWKEWQRHIPDTARRILVTLGGSDPDNVTLKVIQALHDIRLPGLEIRVIVGPANPHRESLVAAVEDNSHSIELLFDVTDMPGLMAWADVAVSAAGSTCWELLFMGLPSVVGVLADNQVLIARGLTQWKSAINLGWFQQASTQEIISPLTSLIESGGQRFFLSTRGRSLVDGRGAEAVVAAMQQGVMLREAQRSDSYQIWQWANDPVVRASSFSPDPISWETHVAWFESQLQNPSRLFFVAMSPDRTPIGQVRFALENHEATISVSLGSQFRGGGYGTKVIGLASQRVFESSPVRLIHAYIKPDNRASVRAFAKAGYQDNGLVVVDKQLAYHMVKKGRE